MVEVYHGLWRSQIPRAVRWERPAGLFRDAVRSDCGGKKSEDVLHQWAGYGGGRYRNIARPLFLSPDARRIWPGTRAVELLLEGEALRRAVSNLWFNQTMANSSLKERGPSTSLGLSSYS
jgi:hypothetical protein